MRRDVIPAHQDLNQDIAKKGGGEGAWTKS